MLNKLKNIFTNKQIAESAPQSQPELKDPTMGVIPSVATPSTIVEEAVQPVELAKPKRRKKATETNNITKKKKANTKVIAKQRSSKDIATERREPYVNIVSVELDPTNIGNGAFELDWNEFFIAKLIRAGYKGSDDAQIVDQWFQDVCRNVVLETFEQFEANNPRPLSGVQRRDIGSGRTEIS